MAAPISAASTTGLAADGRGLNALKLQANNDDPSARRACAGAGFAPARVAVHA